MPKLQWLRLSGTRITDAGLARLESLRSLSWLELWDIPVSDAGLKHIAELKSLRNLMLRSEYHTPEGLAELRRALPNCEISP